MIIKVENTKNGYHIDNTTTNSDIYGLWSEYLRGMSPDDRFEKLTGTGRKRAKLPIRCIICNGFTKDRFETGEHWRGPSFTINNNVPNNVIYINSVN